MSNMNRTHFTRSRSLLGCVVAGVLGASVVAQDAQRQETQRQETQRQETQRQDSERQGQRQGPQDRSIDDLIDQLGDSRYRARQNAEQELRSRGDKAVQDLRRAAKEHEDAEVRWRAGRLVRQIEGQDQGGLRARDSQQPQTGQGRGQGQGQQPGFGQPWTPMPGQLQQLDQMFEQMFQQMERQYGIDIPRRSFFGDPFFQDLQSQMSQRGLGSLQDFEGQGRAMSMRIGEDGVTVTIKEKDESGQVQSRNYEAPDLQSFIQQYPEVAKRLNMTQQSPLPGTRGGFLTIPPMPPAIESLPRARDDARGGLMQRDQRQAQQPEIPEGQRLGVLVRGDLSEDTRAILSLPDQGGLLVEEVMDGSLAGKLGVKPNDVILEIGGTSIVGVEDVQRALADVEEGEEVKVLVNRRGEEQTLRAKKASGSGASAGSQQQKEQKGQGQDQPQRSRSQDR